MVALPCTLADWESLGIVGQVHYGQRAKALPHERAIARKRDAALQLIAQWWERVEGQGYVCISFGKDSLVTWHLAQQVAPIPAMFVALGPLGDWPDCLALRQVLERDYALEVFDVPAIPSLYSMLWEEGVEGHHHGWTKCGETARRLHQEQPWWRGALWGIRGVNEPNREGVHREILLKKRGQLYQREDGRWMCAPVGFWTTRDIWAYIDLHALPYAAMYDVDRTAIRNGAPCTMNGEPLGRVRKFRLAFPEIFKVVAVACGEDFCRHA